MAQNWFPHDYNAAEDEKMLKFLKRHGNKGYGIFFRLIERMAKLETGTIDPNEIDTIAYSIREDEDELSEMVSTLLEVGLFFEDEDGLYRNARVTQHIKKMEGFSESGKKGAEKRWSNETDRGASRGANAEGKAPANAYKSRGDNTKPDNTTKAQYVEENSANEERTNFDDLPLVSEERNDV